MDVPRADLLLNNSYKYLKKIILTKNCAFLLQRKYVLNLIFGDSNIAISNKNREFID